MKVLPYGEDGAYVDLEAGAAPGRAERTHGLAGALRSAFPGADVVAGAGVVAVFGIPGADAAEAVRAAVPDLVEEPPAHVYTSIAPVRTHVIDVVYDGPDLDDVAARLGLSRDRVIDLHAGRDHVVELVGFLPGFAYAGPIDPRLVVPRRPSPRPRVEARSVAIAGSFTAVYPLASPGGWNLLGRSLGPPPFDPSRPDPFLFAPGDRVRFRSVPGAPSAPSPEPRAASDAIPGARAASGAGPALVVARCTGIATVQDAGRPGLLGRGMPPSGPLDPALFFAANRAADNPASAAVIELLAGALHLRARGSVTVSIDGAPARRLADGEELRVDEGRRAVRVLAVTGGIDVPVVVGARATLLSAKIGGIEGRPLRTGDVLRVGAEAEAHDVSEGGGADGRAGFRSQRGPSSEPREALQNEPIRAASLADPPRPDDAPIHVTPGPHLDRFPAGALEALLATEWRASRLRDRTGARLDGPPVPRSGPDLAAPVPMRRGAVQITTDGTPIVLGPDHPTTGGYPVLAVVRRDSLGPFVQRRPGDLIRFRL